MLHLSKAASLAFHAIAIIDASDNETRMTTDKIAEELHVSAAHLAKVLQRLVKGGILKSTRGPHGGFTLAGNPDDTTMYDVYVCVEGPVSETLCVLDSTRCSRHSCVLGTMLKDVGEIMSTYLKRTRLSDIASA